MNLRSVDLTLLAQFAAPGAIVRIDPDVYERLRDLPEVRERIDGCVAFCHMTKIGAYPRYDDKKRGRATDDLNGRRRFLRAALAEFASIEDAAALDLAPLNKRAPLMHETLDPRIHALPLLRHANVHRSATTLDRSQRDATWDGPAGEQAFSYTLILGNSVESATRSVREAKKYAASDLSAMIDWLNEEQKEWGLPHTILRTAETYASIVASAV